MRKLIKKRWDYIKWIIRELIATCSDKPSYFSKKRIQSWILFDAGLFAMMFWLKNHHAKMEYGEIIAFASVLFAAAGYQISTIQREKRFNKKANKDKESVS